ncbi:receptor-like protein EIX2 [Henckelia pumila]|uniref:receptor-like protein EIX2 n=1 Tax=Henckelia pumila TaxID=405737 RepID=UPI003C6DD202
MNFSTKKLLFTCLHMLLVILSAFPVIGTTRVRCLEKERFALLKIKANLISNGGSMSKWGTKEVKKDCCTWDGVQCDNKTNHVVDLRIYDYYASGKISPFLLDLVKLNRFEVRGANFNGGPIPEFMGSLGKLQYLIIAGSNIGGLIPHHLGNLSMLRFLDISGNFLNITNLDWLSSLHSLEYLDLSSNDLSRAIKWLQVIINLPSLNHLGLQSCSLSSATLPPSLSLIINTSTSLSFIDLSWNSISTTPILARFLNVSRSFTHVDFLGNNMTGKIPDSLGNLTFLSTLNLAENRLEGDVPTVLWNSTMLEYVDLSENLLHGSLPDVLKLGNLRRLDLEGNGFVGIVSDLRWCKSLRYVNLNGNMFSGSLSRSIGSLSQLEHLDLSSNKLEGIIDEVHLFNLSQLQTLDLSFNSNLSVKIHSHWNFSFKLEHIGLAYCNLGPKFPYWILKSHSEDAFVDISNARISDTIQTSLWNSSTCFRFLKMPYNQISGIPPDFSCLSFQYLDLSSNEFNGSLPLLGQYLEFVNLAGNKFSGTLANTCNASSLKVLDLSDNQLTGDLPHCLVYLTSLQYLNFANNFLSGEIPKSLCHLNFISSLHLRNNEFGGEFPKALRECNALLVLDLGENNFSGDIPVWIGSSLPYLVVLSLKSNGFYGSLPSTLCHLQSLQLLDLSMNNFSGTIPKCIGNLTSMTSNQEQSGLISYASPILGHVFTFYDRIQIIWKDEEVEYIKNLVLLKAIDLSNNRFVGRIPPEITSLDSLFALNISRNNLVGSIPSNIDQLELLNSLDLSRNNLLGCIPDSLSQLSHLGVLNLSFNNFTGRIPWNTHMQTFNSFSFVGNPGLCGPPLSNSCPEDHKKSNSTGMNVLDNHDELVSTGFYISLMLGFIFGFWGVLGTLILNRSCRYIWFRMLIDVNNWLCVKIAVNWNRMRRYFDT